MTTDTPPARSAIKREPVLAVIGAWLLSYWRRAMVPHNHQRLPWGQSRPARSEFDSLSPRLRGLVLAELALEWLGIAAAVYGVEMVALAAWMK